MKVFSTLFNLATGNVPALVGGLVVDGLRASIARVEWGVVIERFVSRGLVIGMRWLATKTTNKLAYETVDVIIDQLSNPSNKLPRIKEQDVKVKHKRRRRERRD